MKLVFIHGAPAAGKLTTARALLSLVNGRLFDNHAAIDVARTVFDFGAPGFWELVQVVRMSVLDAAGERRTPLVVMTSVYIEPDDLPLFEQFESIVQRRGGQILPVFLQYYNAQLRKSFDPSVTPIGYIRKRSPLSKAPGTSWLNTRYGQFHGATASCWTAKRELLKPTLKKSPATSASLVWNVVPESSIQ